MSSEPAQLPAPLFTAACCAATGVLLADLSDSAPAAGVALAAAAALCATLLSGRRAFWAPLLIAVAGTLHFTRQNLSPSRELLSAMAGDERQTATLQGVIEDIPKETSGGKGGTQSRFPMRVQSSEPLLPNAVNARVLVQWKGATPRCGETVRVRAGLRAIPGARNPGQADAAQYWKRHGVWVEALVVHAVDASVVEAARWWNPTQWAEDCRNAISEQLRRGLEDRPQTHALISSMVLGIHGETLRDERPYFRDTGTLHLFAVSGLNLSMLAGFLAFVLRCVGSGPRLAAVTALPLLFVYAAAAGMGTSCVRALVTSVLLLGGVWTERTAIALNSLGAAAALLLLWDGNCLFESSFQLSFCLVLSLLAGVGPASRCARKLTDPDELLPRRLLTPVQRRWQQVAGWLAASLAVSAVAWIGGLPWGLFLFHQITPVALLANLLAVPVSFGILALGFLAILAAPLGSLTPQLNRTNALLAESLLDFVRWSSRLPGGRFAIADPLHPRPDLLVFDVGDGGAVFTDVGGRAWLLDCGSETHAQSILKPAFQLYGLDRLSGLLLSHGDVHHIGGAPVVREALAPGLIIDTPLKDRSSTRKRVHQALTQTGALLKTAAAGDLLETGPNATLEVLYPPARLEAALADDKALVVKLTTPSWSVLYSSDAGYSTERWLVEHAPEKLAADIWIRGSHSREATGGEDFMRWIEPRLTVIACGPNDRNLSALRAWAEQWRAAGASVWLQADCGAVEAWAGRRKRVRAFLSGDEVRW